MTFECADYYKGLAKAAFMDVATMPFKVPERAYNVLIAAGHEEDARKVRKHGYVVTGITSLFAVSCGVLSAMAGSGLPTEIAMTVGCLYGSALAGSIGAKYNRDEHDKKPLDEIFWPNMTAFKESVASGKHPTPSSPA